MIWQNRSAYLTAVAKIAGRDREPGNRRRQREGVVAGYWQRYCAKNDTIGFFGPLGWGSVRDDGPAVAVRSRGLISARAVHFEAWCLEALARAIGTPAVVPHNRRPELELREQLAARDDTPGIRALDRLEAARADVVDARGCDALLGALDHFDAGLEELTGAPPAPSEAGPEGGRTPLYLDCMRDLDAGSDHALAARAAAVFADHGPAWPLLVFQSADVQIAATELAALQAGDFLAVVSDFHPGNPLTQSLFSARHPEPERFRAQWHADVGTPILAPVMMRNPLMRVTSRNIPTPPIQTTST
ncbi:MAG: lantibiotic dehydratase [Solirubrobacterales bacterium]|nr:lantibiotic dehydratase [Solirubrobacterales bacterium]